MSQCEHNDHGHTMLWLCIWFVFMHSCDSEFDRLKEQVQDLSRRVSRCEEAARHE